MNKKVKNMETALNFGAIVLFFSLFSFLFSQYDQNSIKLISVGIMGIGLFLTSTILEKKFQSKDAAKMYYILSVMSFVLGYIFMGIKGILGTWFSINGEGSYLFVSSIFILVLLISILTKIKYKNYKSIYLNVATILFAIAFLVQHFVESFAILCLVVSLVLLLLNFIKLEEKARSVLRISSYLFFVFVLFYLSTFSLLYTSVILGINTISIFVLMNRYHDFETELFSCILLFFMMIGYSINLEVYFAQNEILAIVTFLLCIFDLCIHLARLLQNEFIQKVYHVVINIILGLLLIIASDYDATLFFAMSVFIGITSVIIRVCSKQNQFEKKLLPIKLYIVIISLLHFISENIFTIKLYLYIVLTLSTLLFGYSFTKDEKVKKVYRILSIATLFYLFIYEEHIAVLTYIASVLFFLFEYYLFFIKEGKESELFSKVFYTIALVLLYSYIEDLPVNHLKFLFLTLFMGGLLLAKPKSKYIMGITIVFFYFSASDYIYALLTNSIGSILDIGMLGFSSLLFATLVVEKEKNKKNYLLVMFTIILLRLLGGNSIIYSFAILFLAILLMIKGQSDKNYKDLNTLGIVSLFLSLLSMLFYIGDIPLFLLLFIVGITIIILVFAMLYNYQNKEEKEEIKVDTKKTNVKYCAECGKAVQKDDSYCGNCGTKILK